MRRLSRAEHALIEAVRSGVRGATDKFHGTPITPTSVIELLSGFDFCVSYFRPDQIELVSRIARSFIIDNGAFSAWRKGIVLSAEYWEGYYAFVRLWLHLVKWFVIPDVIGAGTQEQNALIRDVPADLRAKAVPVWHMDEPISQFLALAEKWPRVAIGSTAEFRVVGSRDWRDRMDELWNEVIRVLGRIPDTHMLRGMQCLLDHFGYPFTSVDSTDIARNHNRAENHPLVMACRWEVMDCPRLWMPRPRQGDIMGMLAA